MLSLTRLHKPLFRFASTLHALQDTSLPVTDSAHETGRGISVNLYPEGGKENHPHHLNEFSVRTNCFALNKLTLVASPAVAP
jgi:hypothetical protein